MYKQLNKTVFRERTKHRNALNFVGQLPAPKKRRCFRNSTPITRNELASFKTYGWNPIKLPMGCGLVNTCKFNRKALKAPTRESWLLSDAAAGRFVGTVTTRTNGVPFLSGCRLTFGTGAYLTGNGPLGV